MTMKTPNLQNRRIASVWVILAYAATFALAAAKSDKPYVQVNLYSGMPNPRFELDENELAQISAHLRKSSPGKNENGAGITAAYGYTGFLVVVPSKTNTDEQTLIKVYRNHVEVLSTHKGKVSSVELRQDDKRDIESLLVSFAETKGKLHDFHKEHITSGKDVRKRPKKKT